MKKICGLLMLGFCTLLLITSCGKQEANSVLLAKSLASAKSADWNVALDLVKKAVKQDPKDVDALILYAICLENTGDAAEALNKINLAVSLDPRNFMAQYTKGRLLYLKGKYDLALAPLKNAYSLRNEDLDSVILLAQTSALLNTKDAAGYYKVLAESQRFKSSPVPWNELGMIFINRNPGLALRYFAKAESLEPDNPNVALNMAVVNDLYLNRKAESVTYYRKYQRLTSKRPELESVREEVARRIQTLSN